MSDAFADTFYYLALLNQRDEAHSDALGFARQHREPIVTTAWVLLEVADAFCLTGTRPQRIRFIDTHRTNPKVTIVPLTSS